MRATVQPTDLWNIPTIITCKGAYIEFGVLYFGETSTANISGIQFRYETIPYISFTEFCQKVIVLRMNQHLLFIPLCSIILV